MRTKRSLMFGMLSFRNFTMKRISYQFLFITLICIVSCSNNQERDGLENSVKILSDNDDITYLVLEQSGCSTCLYKADEFFKEFRHNMDMIYIFTGYTSEKRLRLKYGMTGQESNIIIDKNSEFYRNNVQLGYPSILYFENGSLAEYEVAKTSNFAAYDRLAFNLQERTRKE